MSKTKAKAKSQGPDVADPPWLPCRWCGWMPVDCTCTPITKAEWDTMLNRSEAARLRDLRAAQWMLMHEAWTAA